MSLKGVMFEMSLKVIKRGEMSSKGGMCVDMSLVICRYDMIITYILLPFSFNNCGPENCSYVQLVKVLSPQSPSIQNIADKLQIYSRYIADI